MPVGEDQVQHIEFARECANNFNAMHGVSCLIEPVTLLGGSGPLDSRLKRSLPIASSKKVMSLRDPLLKMSKSHKDPRSRILLSDSNEDIRAKLKLAVTDSQTDITYDIDNRPGVANLLNLALWLQESGVQPSQLAVDLDGLSMRAFKEYVADIVIDKLDGIRDSYLKLLTQDSWLMNLAEDNARIAHQNAAEILAKVRRVMGI